MIQVSNSKAYANDSYDQALVHKIFKVNHKSINKNQKNRT
jgi:hypothetical protein